MKFIHMKSYNNNNIRKIQFILYYWQTLKTNIYLQCFKCN